VPELALDDVHGHSFAREVDGVRVAQLVGSEPATDAGSGLDRYVVTLDAGSELVVTQQNLATTSTEALAKEGKAVRLIWERQHQLPIADGAASGGG